MIHVRVRVRVHVYVRVHVHVHQFCKVKEPFFGLKKATISHRQDWRQKVWTTSSRKGLDNVGAPKNNVGAPRNNVGTSRRRLDNVGAPRNNVGAPRNNVGTSRRRLDNVGATRNNFGAPRSNVGASRRDNLGRTKEYNVSTVHQEKIEQRWYIKKRRTFAKEASWRSNLKGGIQ